MRCVHGQCTLHFNWLRLLTALGCVVHVFPKMCSVQEVGETQLPEKKSQ